MFGPQFGPGTLALYPNPTTDRLYLPLTFSWNAWVQVIDHFGRWVLDRAAKASLDVSHLSAGTYAVLVQGCDGSRAARFVGE